MKHSLANPKTAAIISILICLPFTVLFTLLLLKIEPNFGPLESLLNNPDPNQPDVLGSLIALSTFLLVLVAFLINVQQIIRTVRDGGSLAAHPMNLVLAASTLAAIVVVIGAIIVDQYPCWMGVPNCD